MSVRALESEPIQDPVLDRRKPAGLLILVAIVVVGMGIPAYFRWRTVDLKEKREALLLAAPSEPEARLSRWLEFGRPMIHHALQMARFSDRKPWFVTHVVAPRSASEPPEVWGIDLTGLETTIVTQEGLVARLTLAAPVLLERDVLVGDNALGVPVFQPDVAVPDPRGLALERLVPYFERLERGLGRDIPGATLEIVVGGRKAEAPHSDQGH